MRLGDYANGGSKFRRFRRSLRKNASVPVWLRDEQQGRFWEVFEGCLDKLPAAGARVFFKREIVGEDTAEICKGEGITASNCWVILHRARLALRSCLEKNWFGKEAPSR